MSQLFAPPPGLIFASFLFRSDLYTQNDILDIWKKKFIDGDWQEYAVCPMKEYYSKEMGAISDLKRAWVFSHQPMNRESLVDFKIWATEVENETAQEGARTINFDVGLLTLENMVLATGKPFDHRVYLERGVYADLNYLYQKKSYRALPWTYPDYALEAVREIFNSQRKILHAALSENGQLWQQNRSNTGRI